MQFIRGKFAIPHFRLERLLLKIHYVIPYVDSLTSEYLYLLDTEQNLTPEELAVTLDLLDIRHSNSPDEYISKEHQPEGKLILVVPKIGTISSWSFKATDIFHNCGLKKVRRIERGIAYYIESQEKLTWGDLQAIEDILQEKDQESVFYNIEEAAQLFSIFVGSKIHEAPTLTNIISQFNMNKNLRSQPLEIWSLLQDACGKSARGIVSANIFCPSVIMSSGTESLVANPVSHHFIRETEVHGFIMNTQLEVHAKDEISNEVALGRGGNPEIGFSGLIVPDLHIPGFLQPFERETRTHYNILALEKSLEDHLQITQFCNEYGRATIYGHFRTIGEDFAPISMVGGMGNIRIKDVTENEVTIGMLVVLLGGNGTDQRCLKVLEACRHQSLGNILNLIQSVASKFIVILEEKNKEILYKIAKREACPFYDLGIIKDEKELYYLKENFKFSPIVQPLAHRLSKRMLPKLNIDSIDLADAVCRLLKFPCIADKSFLITIADRSVTGLVTRDQMVGPWQVPVSDCGVIARSFDGYLGQAISQGERLPIAMIDPKAGARMAVGEAITNMGAAAIGALSDIHLSLIGMGEGLKDTIEALTKEFCPNLGLVITNAEVHPREETLSEGALVISAFANVIDIRKTLTPLLDKEQTTKLIFIDLSKGQQRLGGSALAQVYNVEGGAPPDVDDPIILKGFFSCLQQLNSEDKILAYHDRSDGGLFVTLMEMAFASHIGLEIDVSELGEDPKRILFNEELGAVIQVPAYYAEYVIAEFNDYGISHCHAIGTLDMNDDINFFYDSEIILTNKRAVLQMKWSALSYHLQSMRGNPRCAKKQYESLSDIPDPGLNAYLTFEMTQEMEAPMINLNVKPQIAILRECDTQGSGEMVAVFNKVHFDILDVHLNDILSGNINLDSVKGLVVAGGFSYGDTLGAGVGFAKKILFNENLKNHFEIFFKRPDTFSLGIANGCQVLSILKKLIPGAEGWPIFVTNFSEQFECRLSMVEVQKSPSILFQGMEESQLLVPIAHRQGRVQFSDEIQEENAIKTGLATLRYVDSRGRKTTIYPSNPNGSPLGITGLTTLDGRVNIIMPHPERAFRSVQYSWCPKSWGEQSPWLRLFQNARRWVD